MKKSKKERLQNYLGFRNKKEKKDAMLITQSGMIFASIVLVNSWILEINLFFVTAFVLIFILLWNINQIYVRKGLKYKNGNSYVKRKWGTIGIGIYLYYLLSVMITIYIGKINENVFTIIFWILFIIPILSCRLIVNKYWYKFDKKIYYEIDKENPYQKKYLIESKYYWLEINNNE